MKNNRYVLALTLLGCMAGLTRLSAAAGDEVTSVQIGTIHGQLRYDKVFFAVKPGSRVEVTLQNTDEMVHNWVLCKPGDGVTQQVADLAVKLGDKAFELDLVPDTDLVLTHTKLAYPEKTVTVAFTAPREEADYPFVCTVPGHSMTMRGVMRVTKDPANAKVPEYLLVKPPESIGRNFILRELTQPKVVRVTIEDTPSRSIAVGLPAGTHYVFDPVNGRVLYGWVGDFLDVSPDRNGRGGGTCKILGKKFDVGTDGCPIRLGSPNKPGEVRFIGYRRTGTPEFAFTVDGIEVRQTVNAIEGGLIYSFRLPPMKQDVFFALNPEGLKLSSSAGQFYDGVLRIAKDQASAFTVTVKPVNMPGEPRPKKQKEAPAEKSADAHQHHEK